MTALVRFRNRFWPWREIERLEYNCGVHLRNHEQCSHLLDATNKRLATVTAERNAALAELAKLPRRDARGRMVRR